MKAKHLLKNAILASAIALMSAASASAQDVEWKKNFGGNDDDYYESVTTVSDGVVAVGYSGFESFGNGDWIGVSKKGIVDAMIVKYDDDGNVMWKKNFGGNSADYYKSVTAVSDGVVAAGVSGSASFGNGDWINISGKGNDDAIIVKYNNAEVGIEEWKMENGEWRIYPNPTRGELRVESGELRVESVEVYDVLGRKQKAESRMQNAENSYGLTVLPSYGLDSVLPSYGLDISHLPTGVYFLRIQTENGVITKKVVKQ
jgi:hypothetical protein